MDNIKTFLLILFLSKTITLTPVPITIPPGGYEIQLENPISAITKGASLQIEISSMLLRKNLAVVFPDAENKIREIFPKGSITAILKNKEGAKARLFYNGGSLLSEDDKYLSLYGSDIPLKTKWDSVEIISDIELTDVTVVWINYQH